MDLIDIFKKWDASRDLRTSRFIMKDKEEIKTKDTPYQRELKSLINYRIDHKLGRDDIAYALGMNPESIARIERFNTGENWTYIYAMNYIFMRYEEYCLAKKGFVFGTTIPQ